VDVGLLAVLRVVEAFGFGLLASAEREDQAHELQQDEAAHAAEDDGEQHCGGLNPELASHKNARLQQLTMRERSILQLVAEGRTNRTAAEYLSVSPKTVEKHRASLMRKLGLRSATELALTAIEMGLIERPGLMARIHEPPLMAVFGETV
jgi:DNA-binding NarL/FixJ family response regulator